MAEDDDSVFEFDDEDFSERLEAAISESEEVIKVLEAVSRGAGSRTIDQIISEGISEYRLIFKSFKGIKERVLDRAHLIRAQLKSIPKDRMERIRQIEPPEDPLHRASSYILMMYVETNFKMTGQVVEFLTDGPFKLLEAQLQAVEKANGIVIGLGKREFSFSGYGKAAAMDLTGYYAPVAGQMNYLQETFFQREAEKLSEIENESSTLGKAVKFSEYVKLVNSTSNDFERVASSATELMVDFIEKKLPTTLDELGV
ncbi:MAG: hypothetical protein ABJC64_04555 [Paracoccaceae bacterium]